MDEIENNSLFVQSELRTRIVSLEKTIKKLEKDEFM